ncbi:hypothetical protein [Streptomyces sp. NPDC057636]|uniref:hypothetical protein n=1 Tax=Streptomyces sp. NPDC057636 TaxID=3346189 RepID=UPI00367DD57F
MALLDGALLGLAPAAHPDDCPAAVKEYEREMSGRTSTAALMSADLQEFADVAGRRRENARIRPTALKVTEYDQETVRAASTTPSPS